MDHLEERSRGGDLVIFRLTQPRGSIKRISAKQRILKVTFHAETLVKQCRVSGLI